MKPFSARSASLLLGFTLLVPAAGLAADEYEKARAVMVDAQIAARGVKDPRVLAAMRKVPRHEFVPEELRSRAYDDTPLPIGEDQTISQPYIVAYMAEQLRLTGDEKVLEIGTGSGYGAAVLAELAKQVFTIEILEKLARRAAIDLTRLGYGGVQVRFGDGYRGWPEEAPFDAIVVTAAPDEVPKPLLEQLKVGGRMIVPVGRGSQTLRLVTRTEGGFKEEELLPVRFVPMTGEVERKK